MSDKKPEALQLADAIHCRDSACQCSLNQAAAELRRLHEVNRELMEALHEMLVLYGCGYDKEMIRKDAIEISVIDKARAAIAKATGEQA